MEVFITHRFWRRYRIQLEGTRQNSRRGAGREHGACPEACAFVRVHG